MSFKQTIKKLNSIFKNNFKLLRLRQCGKHSLIGPGLIINGSRFKEKITIGKNVSIGRYARLGNTFSKGDGIVISDGCQILNYFTAIGGEIHISEDCLIASHVTIIASNHSLNPEAPGCYSNHALCFKPVYIGKECWISENVTILPGVSIGDKCVIGAGSVVTKDIPSLSIAVGNPARVIKRWNSITKVWDSV